jgi:hypothetical protein
MGATLLASDVESSAAYLSGKVITCLTLLFFSP